MDDFQVVRHKGRKKQWQKKNKKPNGLFSNNFVLVDDIDVDKCRKQIQDIRYIISCYSLTLGIFCGSIQ